MTQIDSGDFDFSAYGSNISGSGGANQSDQIFPVATLDDPHIGSDNPVVTIVEFSDFECPFCGEAFPIIRKLVSAYGDSVQLIYRDFPLADIHPNARTAAIAGYCADTQGKFWQLHDLMFQHQDDLSLSAITVLARQIGIDVTRFYACIASQQATEEVDRDIADGIAAGVQGTPTWFINGMRVAGVIPENVFRQMIEESINQ